MSVHVPVCVCAHVRACVRSCKKSKGRRGATAHVLPAVYGNLHNEFSFLPQETGQAAAAAAAAASVRAHVRACVSMKSLNGFASAAGMKRRTSPPSKSATVELQR